MVLPEGKTLRSHLAEKLRCDPMRITKKYAGASCLGKRIRHLCESPKFSRQDIERAKSEIDHLEQRFHMRLEQGVGVPLPPTNPTSSSHVSIGSGIGEPVVLPNHAGSVVGVNPVVAQHHHHHPHVHAHAHADVQAPTNVQQQQPAMVPSVPNFPQMAFALPPTANGVNANAPAPAQVHHHHQAAPATTADNMMNNPAMTAAAAQSFLASLAHNAQLAAAAGAPNSTGTSPTGSVVPTFVQQPQPQPQQPQPQHQQPQQQQYQAAQPSAAAAPAPQAPQAQQATHPQFHPALFNWQQMMFNSQAAAAAAAATTAATQHTHHPAPAGNNTE